VPRWSILGGVTGGSRRKLRLGWVLVLGFATSSVLPFIGILAYGYRRNQAAISTNLDAQLARDTARHIHRLGELVDGVVTATAIVREAVEADPALFHTDRSYGVIWRAVATAFQIDALYASFEDGHHRVVSRIDAQRRASDPQIPAGAIWHASYIDAFAAGAARARHRSFHATWPAPPIGAYAAPTSLDIRTLPHYVAAKATDQLAIADPVINPDTGAAVMSLAWPVHADGQFIGIVGANLTLSALSAYLRDNRFSAHSLTVVIDDAGRVISHPDLTATVRMSGGRTELARVGDLADRRIAEALAARAAGRVPPFRFVSAAGEELAVAAAPFPAAFGRPGEVLIVAPTDDFVGDLAATNRAVFGLLALAVLAELLLVYLLARSIATHLVRISRQFNSARRLSFAGGRIDRSFIGEIADLEGGFALLQNALSSFAKFVPVDVVTQFIASGEPVAPGVSERAATIFFCDLEGFSGQAERLTPERLLAQLTQYFATITGAIAEEHGTIDKFIGDAVMAFWAPAAAGEDHARRACAAAIRARRRMEILEARWRAEGHPVMNVRFGLHASPVLVGNIGSPERLSYTAIGDGVNVASRIEGINKAFDSSICVSEAVVVALGGRALARPLRTVQVKGRQQELMVYELLALTDTTDPELLPRPGDVELVRLATVAADLRGRGDTTGAIAAYRALLAAVPADVVTQALLAELAPG